MFQKSFPFYYPRNKLEENILVWGDAISHMKSKKGLEHTEEALLPCPSPFHTGINIYYDFFFKPLLWLQGACVQYGW